MNQQTTLNRQQIAAQLNIHASTLARWIKKYNLPISRGSKVLTPAEIKILKDRIGDF